MPNPALATKLLRTLSRGSKAASKAISRVTNSVRAGTLGTTAKKALTKLPAKFTDSIVKLKSVFSKKAIKSGALVKTPTWLTKSTASLSKKFPKTAASIASVSNVINKNKYAKWALTFVRDIAIWSGVSYAIDSLMEDDDVSRDEATQIAEMALRLKSARFKWMGIVSAAPYDASASIQIEYAADSIAKYIFARDLASLKYFNENFSTIGKFVLAGRLMSLAKDLFVDSEFENASKLFLIQSAFSDEREILVSEALESYVDSDHKEEISRQSVDDMLLHMHLANEAAREDVFRRFIDECDVWPDKSENIDFDDDDVIEAMGDVAALSFVAFEPLGMMSDYVDDDEADEVFAHNIVEASAVAADVTDAQGRFHMTGDVHFFNTVFR